MIFVHRAPQNPPPFSVLVDDQGKMHPQKMAVLANYLGVSVQTFQRWLKTDDAPHAARMALWWVSTWGPAVIDSAMHNELKLLSGQMRSLIDANNMLRARIARLEEVGSFGSANMPYYQPERVALGVTPGR